MTLVWTLGVCLLAVVSSFPLTRFLGRHAGWPLAVLYLAGVAAFWPAAAAVLDGDVVTWSRPWVPELGLDLSLRADGIGLVFVMIALVIGAVVLAYSTAYLKPGRNLTFYLYLAVFTVSMVGLVLADDLILLFLCWELTSLASFLLIARSGFSGEAASMRTLLITFLGGLTLLAAVGVMVAATGTTGLQEAMASPVWDERPGLTTGVAVLVLLSAFTKSAQFPFHVWLPDAMAAATPVSAYLHAAAVVKAGIFLLLRFSPLFHDVPAWNVALVAVGLFTCALGGWFALRKTDLKKLMAYSTVSQLGLIVAAIGVGTEYALTAAVLHVIAHALFKSGLFMMVGVIDHSTGTRDVRRLPELRRAMPLAFWTTVIGCASMAGVPPMLGFVSKESILTGLLETPGPAWTGWAAFVGAVLASVLTFSYCAKIVFHGFVDGRGQDRWAEDAPLHATPPAMGIFAALPILAGLPLALVVGVLDVPLDRALAAARPDVVPETHLALWHGVNVELVASLLIIAAGVAVILGRRRLLPSLEPQAPGPDGAAVIEALTAPVARAGMQLALLVRADSPTRHVAPILVMLTGILGGGSAGLLLTGRVADQHPGLDRWIDGVALVVILLGVAGVCMSQSRLAAVVSLSAVGAGITVQIFALGGPDVGLTQLLVEALTVLMVMLVLQKLPLRFGRSPRWGQRTALALAVSTGAAAGLGAFVLTGRRERSEIADYYLTEGPEITHGYNVVNTILVEFRALDTLGELTVLGMAGAAMVAVLSTVRDRYLDPPPDQDRSFVADPQVPLRGEGSAATRAVQEAWGNAVPMQLLVRVTAPLLVIISLLLFWRGHNAPGGGFIAALVGSAIVALVYLSSARDQQVGPARLPMILIGSGITLAILTGIFGLVVDGSFLAPVSRDVGWTYLTSALLFDLGVYAAVLGLVMEAFNLLGATGGREGTRERADESVEGELAGPMDSSRGETPLELADRERAQAAAAAAGVPDGPDPRGKGRVGRGTTYLVHGVPPGNLGDRSDR
jgi:multicomponent Na+:H+ antiporter subunit A